MKHFKTWIISLPLLWISVGCSDELAGDPVGDVAGKLHEVEITFNMGVNAGLHLSGRSANMPIANTTKSNTSVKPRELTTWEPAQQVNDMRIYVFRCSEKEGKDGDYTFYVPTDLENAGKDYYDVSEKGISRTNPLIILKNTRENLKPILFSSNLCWKKVITTSFWQ